MVLIYSTLPNSWIISQNNLNLILTLASVVFNEAYAKVSFWNNTTPIYSYFPSIFCLPYKGQLFTHWTSDIWIPRYCGPNWDQANTCRVCTLGVKFFSAWYLQYIRVESTLSYILWRLLAEYEYYPPHLWTSDYNPIYFLNLHGFSSGFSLQSCSLSTASSFFAPVYTTYLTLPVSQRAMMLSWPRILDKHRVIDPPSWKFRLCKTSWTDLARYPNKTSYVFVYLESNLHPHPDPITRSPLTPSQSSLKLIY